MSNRINVTLTYFELVEIHCALQTHDRELAAWIDLRQTAGDDASFWIKMRGRTETALARVQEAMHR